MSKSYCEGICEYENTTTEPKICRGCGRTAEEITEWFYATEERKREIAKSARKRSKERKTSGSGTLNKLPL